MSLIYLKLHTYWFLCGFYNVDFTLMKVCSLWHYSNKRRRIIYQFRLELYIISCIVFKLMTVV